MQNWIISTIISLVAGIFSAVPAATAICVGSSRFMWSATAGFIFSDKVTGAGIKVEDRQKVVWGAGQYFKYGIVSYLVQISIALAAAMLVLSI